VSRPYTDQLISRERTYETTEDDAELIEVMAEKSRTTGMETVLRRGLMALREGPLRAPHTSPGDKGVEEEQSAMMPKKRHAINGRWATHSQSMMEQKSENFQTEINSRSSRRTPWCM
jgi:hypothetical protein